MKTFDYAKADSPEAAVSNAGAGVKFIAGGTNLLDLMKLQIETPTKLVDISRLDLAGIEEREDGGLTIGQRHAWDKETPGIFDALLAMEEAAKAGAAA